ncbi:S-layer homology domain-containing protein [Fusibacter ferrireducens]|uniref:S-layer homology domain-containing protein n=1 Tax=Fusibacter ferrireducens TaxID=2785058 RepID=A0ABR9ZMF8_9FIRM|nr:S-layer homology domain-containing protein [Fusibacter ferrireducens]MBF4691643.1 S-layer homology domain-containing protein [Fusibacter ferrireducens]
MKQKNILLLIVLLVGINFNIASANTDYSFYLEGKLLQVNGFTFMTLEADGTYRIISEGALDQYKEVYVFVNAEKEGELLCLAQKISSEETQIKFKAADLIHKKITIGKAVNPLDGIVTLEFRNLSDEMKIELNLNSGEEKQFAFSNNLEVQGIYLVDMRGSLGIPQGLVESFSFNGDYVLTPKVQEVIMSEEPSFEDLFEIAQSSVGSIGELFIMGPGGGCDYEIINTSGESVYQGKFGHVTNRLHYEAIDENQYKMKFSFNGGDLVLESEYMAFVKAAKKEEDDIATDNDVKNTDESKNRSESAVNTNLKESAFYEIKVAGLPLPQNQLDINALVKRSEPGILIHLDIDDQFEGIMFNRDDLSKLANSGKQLAIQTQFGSVSFSSDCLKEMVQYDGDLSMKFRYENAFSKPSEIRDFMIETYGSQVKANMNFVSSYELRVFAGEKDVIGTEFNNRPQVAFFTKTSDYASAQLNKISAFIYNESVGKLEMIESKWVDDAIKVKVKIPMPFHYFNLYEVNKTFDDISKSWAKPYIESLASKNIVSGVSDVTFNPAGKLTRAQFVTLLVRGLGIGTSDQGASFSDVHSGDWFASYVNAASKMALLEDHIGTSFSPNSEMMRKDMAEMAVKAYEKMSGKSVSEKASKVFEDVPSGSGTYISKAVNLGLVSGISETEFKPNDALTREQAAYIIYKLLEMIG